MDRYWILQPKAYALNALLILLIAAAAVFQSPPRADAQEEFVNIGGGNVVRLSVSLNSTVTVTTSQSFADLIIGNNSFIDVVPLTDRALFIRGKGPGATNVSFYDKEKRLIGVLDVRVQVNMTEVQRAIRAAVPGARVRVSNVNNRIRLSGTVQDGRQLSRIIDIAQQYSGQPILNQVRVADAQQVLLEVRIMEATRQAGRDLGIGFRGENEGGDVSLLSAVSAVGAASGGAPFGQLIAKVLSISGTNIDIIIQALEEKGLVRRLAQPNLVALSGQQASFHAGGEVPIGRVVQSGQTVATETDYRPYGVRLAFTPVVLDNGLVNLVIEPEVSEIDPSVVVNGNPGFISRKAKTTVELRDGQSFALAGLLSTVNSRNIETLPWLGSVPVLGALFRSTSFQKRESDLVIIVTPHIVRPSNPGEKLFSPLDQTRPSDDVELFALGLLEVDKDMIRGFREGTGVVGPYGHIIDLDFGDGGVVRKN